MRRVLVIGSPGTGKSHLAKEMSALLDLPLVHLDRLYHDPRSRYPEDKPAWRQFVTGDLLGRAAWVMDGHHPTTLEARLARTDAVVFLDYPTRTAILGAIRRRVRPPSYREDVPSQWRDRLSAELLRSIILFRFSERPPVQRLLERHADGRAVFVLAHPAQARRFLSDLPRR